MNKMVHLSTSISGATKTYDVVQRIINATYEMLCCERVTLFLVDAPARQLIMTRSKDVEGKRVPMDRGIAGTVASTGYRLNIQDAYSCPLFNKQIDAETGFVTRSVLSMPVKDQDHATVAVLQAINRLEPAADSGHGTLLYTRQLQQSHQLRREGAAVSGILSAGPHPFSELDEQALQYMADHAGTALSKSLMLDEVERARRTTESLLDVVKCMAEEKDVHRLIDAIIAAAYKYVASMCLIPSPFHLYNHRYMNHENIFLACYRYSGC